MSSGSIRVRGRFPGAVKACDVEVRDGVVRRVVRAGKAEPDFGSSEAFIGPTLFDIQVNGVGGIDLQGDAVRPEDLRAITEYLARWGVSRWIPTLVTGPHKAMEHGCRVIVEALKDRAVARAVPGLHIEGPYISPEDGPRGAHPKKHVCPPNIRDFEKLRRAAEGKILYTTVAPELPGAVTFIRAVTRRGVLVSLGHHHGTAEDIARAVDAGAQLSTHLGNGAASMIHRHSNPLWPQLANDGLMASLIADLHHLPPDVLKTFVRAKGPGRIVLTSDCVNLAGLKPGKYSFAGAEVELRKDGMICLSGTDLLAGSGLMLLQGVVNTWQHTDLTLEQAFACASSIPARLFGLRTPPRLPMAGRKADFTVFELKGKGRKRAPRIEAVFIRGSRVMPSGKTS